MSALRVGSRSSPLAVVQVKEVFALLNPPVPYELTAIKTRGDLDQSTSLTAHPADNFFTDTIDLALLDNQIDVAVHSAKDVPQRLPAGLEIFALTAGLPDSDAWVGQEPWGQLSPGARVGTSSQLRRAQVLALKPQAVVVDIRGTIEQRLGLIQQGKVSGVIVASCALYRLKLEHKIQDILPWEGMPLQGQLAVVGRSRDYALRELFKKIDVRKKYGTVILVGAGPGDPGLITVNGMNALAQAECVFYDFLVDKQLLQHAPGAEHVYVGKRKGDHSLPQSELSRMLRRKAMEGKNVVRLKGGDPLVFGRGADEIQYLASYHVPYEIIPGVSSATGIPARLGIPLTARGTSSSVAFISGHEGHDEAGGGKPLTLPQADTLVFLMGLTKLKDIVSALKIQAWPLDTPVLIVSRGTKGDEMTVTGTVATIETASALLQPKPPALIIAGKTAGFYPQPGVKTYLYCGTHPELYAHLGRVVPWPTIDIRPIAFSADRLQRLNADFEAAELIVLTSPAAVSHFMPLILGVKTLQQINQKIFAVIGQQTAQRLHQLGGYAGLISTEETAQGLFKTLRANFSLTSRQILFPRSALPNPYLRDALQEEGAQVKEWAVYENLKPAKRPLPDMDIHGIIFTSPSTVTNFLADYHNIPWAWEILAKGPVTQGFLKEQGYESQIL